MFDHIGLAVANYDTSKAFYLAALRPLGIEISMEVTAEEKGGGSTGCGLGRNGRPELWLSASVLTAPAIHIAFTASDRADVRAFHEAALAAGGVDNGPPGLRPHYHANYYAAFVLDPDGHNLEAVCHQPE
ncbi:VOC family protein [Terrihabitans sp. B22-R8]|uniref:VOC family protein n=1 Tax=Terrihabitans sp. B22-R8 TaxID=3425128 RepID=UPI00403CEADB